MHGSLEEYMGVHVVLVLDISFYLGEEEAPSDPGAEDGKGEEHAEAVVLVCGGKASEDSVTSWWYT